MAPSSDSPLSCCPVNMARDSERSFRPDRLLDRTGAAQSQKMTTASDWGCVAWYGLPETEALPAAPGREANECYPTPSNRCGGSERGARAFFRALSTRRGNRLAP